MRLLKLACLYFISTILLIAEPENHKTVHLPIPPRQQWSEFNGYCGECSIQQAALYFGTYVSQHACRGIIDSHQQTEVLVGANERQVLTALRLRSEEFDHDHVPTPQFKEYFCWVKRHLQVGNPVMIVAWEQDGHDPDYDHIVLATGFTTKNAGRYDPFDQLFFNNNFSPTTVRRFAASLPDTREMEKNGKVYETCMPEHIGYGCAVTGIVDDSHAVRPVQVHLGIWNEPEVIAGKTAVLLNASVTIGGLTTGRAYTLFRYNDYLDVPTKAYAESEYTSAESFVAIGSTKTLPAKIISDGIAIFRCLPAGR